MRKGWWVLLDEVNLAEPQILERLNSVLEVEPTLILTEYDNSPIDPVHPGFRLFATMNPAEYAGRSADRTSEEQAHREIAEMLHEM